MIQSFMSYVDVVFPVALGPLTYNCPAELIRIAAPGMVVSAPLRNRTARGILWSTGSARPAGPVRDVTAIHGKTPVLGRGLMNLLRWMADYYLASEGMVLKQTVPKEIFDMSRSTRRSSDADLQVPAVDFTTVAAEDISDVLAAVSEKHYRTFLVRSGSSIYEYSLATAFIAAGLRNVMFILPEISRANTLSGMLRERFGERVCVLHGDIAGGRRSEYMRGMLAGTRDIIVGTGLALFAPMPQVSLIMVLSEHSSSYKREEGIRYNIRDAAVMRGYMEKSPVVLASIAPSVDSSFNALSGKYSFIKPQGHAGRPRIRTIDMRFERKTSPGISKTVLDAARGRLRQGKRIMFVINRRGHSTLLLCADCGHTALCPSCNIPLVLHKKEKTLKCHYCGLTRTLPGRCDKCGGYHIELLGYGTQKVQEEITRLLGTEAVRFDSDEVRKNSEIANILKNIAGGTTKVIVGTKMMTKRLGAEKFGLAVVLNVDSSLNVPDFRASEKAYSELSSIIDLLEPEGRMIIQTRFPQNPIFKYLREDDYKSFVREELMLRKALDYPPYRKLLKITFSGNIDLSWAEEATRMVDADVEVLGPVVDRNRRGTSQITVLLKSPDRRLLRAEARKIMGFASKIKGLKVVVDVDPA